MEKRPLEDLADDQVAALHPDVMPGRAASATIETLFRVRDALDRNATASDAVANRIWWLTAWLLVFTVAIFALTFVLSWDALKELWGIA